VAPAGSTRAAAGMQRALAEHPGAVVLIGSAPTALEVVLEQVAVAACPPPALVIGMPVGFVGVAESKRQLAASGLPQIRLDGSRGGAGLVAAAVNALLRRAWLLQAAILAALTLTWLLASMRLSTCRARCTTTGGTPARRAASMP
jgi:precorrin-8X/cobalt-precorrin-8 methylmutase